MGDKRMTENDWVQKYDSCIDKLSKQKSVPQHGKDYFTVATRHNLFMKYFSDRAEINTDIIPELCNDKRVAVKCTINVCGNKYTGMALEEFGSSFINKTSALENAETSALGRALAAFGLHGSEFASAEELANALKQQSNGQAKDIPIEKQTTVTRLNALYSDWKTKNDLIEGRFKKQEETINKTGGTYG